MNCQINVYIYIYIYLILKIFKKHVAQWKEHQIPILKVGGSIPFMLNFYNILIFLWG